MAWAWIELDGEQAGSGPTRVVVAKLSREGYVAQVLIGTRTQTLVITGRKLTPFGTAGYREPATCRAVGQQKGRGRVPADRCCSSDQCCGM